MILHINVLIKAILLVPRSIHFKLAVRSLQILTLQLQVHCPFHAFLKCLRAYIVKNHLNTFTMIRFWCYEYCRSADWGEIHGLLRGGGGGGVRRQLPADQRRRAQPQEQAHRSQVRVVFVIHEENKGYVVFRHINTIIILDSWESAFCAISTYTVKKG